MRARTSALVTLAAAAVALGVAVPALANSGPPAPGIADAPGSGQSVVDWNRQLITILGTPDAQPATIHPTRSFAILQAAEYDAVVSITRAAPPYKATVPAAADARPDVAADQAAHDVLAALYPTTRAGADDLLRTELAAVPDGEAKQDGIAVGQAAAAQLLDAARLRRRHRRARAVHGGHAARRLPADAAEARRPDVHELGRGRAVRADQRQPVPPGRAPRGRRRGVRVGARRGREPRPGLQHHPHRGRDRGRQVLERLADLEHLEPGRPATRG